MPPSFPPSEAGTAPLNRRIACSWFLYGAAGSVLFLAVTNIITAEVTPMPLLWVLPLAIYLGTFCLAYKQNPWVPVWTTNPPYRLMIFSALTFFFSKLWLFPVLFGLLALLVVLFFSSLYCQVRLYGLRPRTPEHLASYYCLIAFGGLVGGMVVTWLIPLVARIFIEMILGILVLYLAWLLEVSEGARPSRAGHYWSM